MCSDGRGGGLRRLRSPLRARRTAHTVCLVCLRMDVLGWRRAGLVLYARRLAVAQKGQSRFDVLVLGVQFGGALVGIESIVGLIVAGLVLWPSQRKAGA